MSFSTQKHFTTTIDGTPISCDDLAKKFLKNIARSYWRWSTLEQSLFLETLMSCNVDLNVEGDREQYDLAGTSNHNELYERNKANIQKTERNDHKVAELEHITTHLKKEACSMAAKNKQLTASKSKRELVKQSTQTPPPIGKSCAGVQTESVSDHNGPHWELFLKCKCGNAHQQPIVDSEPTAMNQQPGSDYSGTISQQNQQSMVYHEEDFDDNDFSEFYTHKGKGKISGTSSKTSRNVVKNNKR